MRRIFCVLVAAFFMLPMNVVMIDDTKGDTEYLNVWREAESWDRSYDTNSEEEWDIPSYSTASNEEYTRQQNKYYNGDYAEWDFTVCSSGTYIFWVRHWVDNNGCDEVILQWNGNTIGSDSWYQAIGGNYWEWTCFGTMTISKGPGTLRLESQVWRFMETDNIVITADPTFTPTGTGVEGSTNHTIGYGCNTPPTANDDTASTDEDSSVWIDVLSNNDYDNNGSLVPSTVTVTSNPSDGSTTVNTTTGDIKYTPDPGFYGADGFTYTVDDKDGATSNPATVTISVNEVINDPPCLSSGYVNPESGSTATDFTYWVTYTDPEDDSPTKQRVYIDGSPHAMVYDSTYSNGIYFYHKYKYQTTLSEGDDHTYYFVFNDGHNPDVRLLTGTGTYSGPSVSEEGTPEISFEDYIVDDDYVGDSFGSGNGLVEGGETIELMVTLENTGYAAANDIYAYLSTDDSLITVSDDYADYGAISAGATATDKYVFEVDINHEDGEAVFTLEIHDGDGNSWMDTFTVYVYECTGLNYTYVREITQLLSNVTFDAYNESEIAKGRAFGTKGERFAATQIKNWMNDLSLDQVYIDGLDGAEACKLEVLGRGLKVDDGSTGYHPVECYISPAWWSIPQDPFETHPTTNYSYWDTDLEVYPRPDCTESDEFYWANADNISAEIENGNITNFDEYINYSKDFFEDYYNFTFENFSHEVSDTWPTFYSGSYPESQGLDYVFIDEDPWNNPNASFPYAESKVENGSDPSDDEVIFLKFAKVIWDMWTWRINHRHCRGLILFDFHEHTHNMINADHMALPILFINGTVGAKINNSLETHTVRFYINQRWNTSVESYNVIGRINGAAPSKTIIVSCLYDNWWNQGTADSAIGMGIVLGIADYFKRNDITPNCNMKFIAFAGEEKGYLGAKDYVKKNLLESIDYVIDLNQLGFTEPLDERLTFNIMTNDESVNSTVRQIAGRTDYVYRTNNLADFTTRCLDGGGPSNNHPFDKWKPRCKTILFLKDTGWTMHHRDGRKNGVGDPHSEGDVFDYYHDLDVHVTGEMVLNITLHYTVESSDPYLSHSPTSHDFGDMQEGEADSTSFEIWNSGSETLTYSLSESCSWVNVSPTSGSSTDEHGTII